MQKTYIKIRFCQFFLFYTNPLTTPAPHPQLQGKTESDLATYDAVYMAYKRTVTLDYAAGLLDNTGIDCPCVVDVFDRTRHYCYCRRLLDRPTEPPCFIAYYTKRQYNVSTLRPETRVSWLDCISGMYLQYLVILGLSIVLGDFVPIFGISVSTTVYNYYIVYKRSDLYRLSTRYRLS